jgi:hypothetical protein
VVQAIRNTKAARQGNLFQVRNTMSSSSSATLTPTIDDLLTAVAEQHETIVNNINGFEQLSGGNYAIFGKIMPHASYLTSDGGEIMATSALSQSGTIYNALNAGAKTFP